MTTSQRPSAVVSAQLRTARRRGGLSVPQLAARCAELGCPELTAASIHNLESRRPSAGRPPRPVNVDELMCLAAALSVAPVNLLVPLTDAEPYQITPALAEPAGTARTWVRGRHPLKGSDRRMYYTHAPETELARADELAKLIDVAELGELAGAVHVITEQEDS